MYYFGAEFAMFGAEFHEITKKLNNKKKSFPSVHMHIFNVSGVLSYCNIPFDH
jgi:hypothetical protein